MDKFFLKVPAARAGFLLCLFLLVPVFAGAAPAQARPTGGLKGTITDQTGGVLVDAVVILSGPSGERRTTTNGQGVYSFDQLAPGRYTVAITAAGFPPFAATVNVKAQATATFDASLRVGVSMSVQVTEPSGLSLDPRKNKSSLILTGKALAGLPDNPALMMKRLLAMAGSTGRRGDVAIFVDGFREYRRLPPKDTIEMIRINSNPFSAEFAQPGAARIEITTKPGSDTYHGQMRAQARSSSLDSKNALAGAKEVSDYRNYNGYVQGPIKKNRLGFMLYGGQWIEDENAVIQATVLDAATSAPKEFLATVATPDKLTNVMAKLDLSVFGQAINTSFSRTIQKAQGQGLTSGLDLPDHAFDSNHDDSVGRLWWTRIGTSTLNDFRVEVTRSEDSTTPLSSAPAVLVLDAFNGGGSPKAGMQTTGWTTQAMETFTALRSAHTFKAGVLWQTTDRKSVDRTGFNGTFTFGTGAELDANGVPVLDEDGNTIPISPIELYRRTVLGTPGYRPSQFAIVAGGPADRVTQWNLGFFALDDWSVSKRVSLSYGVRQDSQNNLKWQLNLAPRMALSWLLDDDGDNALKFGAGVFYSDVDSGITLDTRRRDGERRRFFVRQPTFFPAVPSSEALGAGTLGSASLYTKSPELRTPRSVVASASFERQLPLGLFGVVEYQFVKGTRLLRLRNLTPPSVAGAATAVPQLQFESTGHSTQHEVMVGLRLDASARISFFANYRVGKTRSDTDDAYAVPSNSLDPSVDFGAASEDRRHEILTGFSATLPGRISFDANFSLMSGLPFNITTGRDDNRDSFFLDRPAFAQPEDPGAVVTPFGVFNPNPGPDDTIIPRNFGRERWEKNLDLTVSRPLFKGMSIAVYAQNVLNSVNLVRFSGVLSSPTFGTPRQALNARRFEFTISYGF